MPRLLLFFTLLFAVSFHACSPRPTRTMTSDLDALHQLNVQFIQNYITQNVAAHSEIIHPDFVCIENSGHVVDRETYLKNWATDYQNSGVTAFRATDEHIRVFGNMAIVRAVSEFEYPKDGKTVVGRSIYTDTYVKENGRWRCVQAHMTPVR
jgi:ketosteroid isomerase-like protein